jgi:DNA repair protein RadC
MQILYTLTSLNSFRGIGAIFILGGKRMSKYQTINHQQLELLKREVSTKQPAKRVNIVSLKLVRESSVLYRERQIKSPEDAYRLLKPFLVEADREKFVVVCLDTKNQPINYCQIRHKYCSSKKFSILFNEIHSLVSHNYLSSPLMSDNKDV